MSKISDELRKYADRWCRKGRPDGIIVNASEVVPALRRSADRIDSEMVELPRGKDGRPVKPGQTVYKAVNGDDGEYVIHSLRYSAPEWVVLIKRVGADASCIVRPDVLTHERPDSWERIADELDEMVDAADHPDDTCEKLADLAERIRRLAAKEDKEAGDGSD